MKYVADDGTEFKTEVECLEYEKSDPPSSYRLGWLVGARIENEYVEDAGFSIITEQNVVDFIENNFAEICEILGDRKEESDGWISNIGRTDLGTPENLRLGAKIEVRFRNGEQDTGFAGDWKSSWQETKGWDSDIVAYRVLKG